MTLKEKYDFVVENISKKPQGTFTIYEPNYIPKFLTKKDVLKENKGVNTFDYELNEKATENDYREYIVYVLEYTGMDESFNVDDLKKELFDSDNDFENWEN